MVFIERGVFPLRSWWKMHLVHQPLVLGVWLVLHDLFRLVIFDVIRMRVDLEFSVNLVHVE